MKPEPIPFQTAEQCIHHRFDDIAYKFPDRKAVSDEQLSYTYAQLQKEANKLANDILRQLGSGNGNIALLIGNNVHQVVAILGILKAGRSYVALDTSFPDERNKAINADAGCSMLLCTQNLKEAAIRIGMDSSIEVVDKVRNELVENLPVANVHPAENAITLYTSGSTGEPKGVLQSHRNMVHFIKRMSDQQSIYPEDKVAYYLSVGFSAHALPMLGSLLNGCELKIYGFKSGNFHGFGEWLKTEGITFIMTIPSFLRHFLAVQDKSDKYPHLRVIYFGGETLYRSDIEKARMVFDKHCLMVNIYASTEAYIMRSFTISHDTIVHSNIVPIGYPVDGMKIYLRDDQGQTPARGSLGEIILESEYLTEGYQNKAELQKKDFSTNPENPSLRLFNTADLGYMIDDDCMVHAGRKDTVIKLRGFRVDFGEIINILLSAENIKEATCALKTNPQGVEHIIAYAVSVDHSEADIEYLNAIMVRMLPDYMIPTHIVCLPELHKSDVGKTDSKDLPEPEWNMENEKKFSEPENETEAKVLEIFKKTLKLEILGTKDNLLKTGSDSLGLFVAFSGIEKSFDIKLDIQEIIKSPDVKSIAAYVAQNKQS